MKRFTISNAKMHETGLQWHVMSWMVCCAGLGGSDARPTGSG